MSYTLCGKVKNLTPYEPIKGHFDIRLDANESYIPLPDSLKARIAARIADTAFNRYPDPLAAELCSAFGALYDVSPELLTAGNGSDELISVITGCLLEDGDSILTFAPDFSMYRFYGELSEHPVYVMGKDDDFRIDIDEVIRTVKEKNVKMLIFSNPCNPCSVGIERDEIRRLIRSVDALVILDEAYMDFWDQSLLAEVEEYDNLIILKTCSKAVGMAALRVGFAVANKTLTRAMRAVKSPYNVNTLSQDIAALVLAEKDFLHTCTGDLLASREQLQNALDGFAAEYPAVFEKVWPSVTNFIMIRTAKARKLQKALMDRSIAVRCFDGYLRITAGSPEENARLLAAVKEILETEEKE
ncbi:MAG: histidinol-phosphate aminotransferase family protein [Oscillospiraceae bacterium]|nr:histidinol-phosphate aminotransferase family protein [Oscillospiraceae bacterium]